MKFTNVLLSLTLTLLACSAIADDAAPTLTSAMAGSCKDQGDNLMKSKYILSTKGDFASDLDTPGARTWLFPNMQDDFIATIAGQKQPPPSAQCLNDLNHASLDEATAYWTARKTQDNCDTPTDDNKSECAWVKTNFDYIDRMAKRLTGLAADKDKQLKAAATAAAVAPPGACNNCTPKTDAATQAADLLKLSQKAKEDRCCQVFQQREPGLTAGQCHDLQTEGSAPVPGMDCSRMFAGVINGIKAQFGPIVDLGWHLITGHPFESSLFTGLANLYHEFTVNKEEALKNFGLAFLKSFGIDPEYSGCLANDKMKPYVCEIAGNLLAQGVITPFMWTKILGIMKAAKVAAVAKFPAATKLVSETANGLKASAVNLPSYVATVTAKTFENSTSKFSAFKAAQKTASAIKKATKTAEKKIADTHSSVEKLKEQLDKLREAAKSKKITFADSKQAIQDEITQIQNEIVVKQTDAASATQSMKLSAEISSYNAHIARLEKTSDKALKSMSKDELATYTEDLAATRNLRTEKIAELQKIDPTHPQVNVAQGAAPTHALTTEQVATKTQVESDIASLQGQLKNTKYNAEQKDFVTADGKGTKEIRQSIAVKKKQLADLQTAPAKTATEEAAAPSTAATTETATAPTAAATEARATGEVKSLSDASIERGYIAKDLRTLKSKLRDATSTADKESIAKDISAKTDELNRASAKVAEVEKSLKSAPVARTLTDAEKVAARSKLETEILDLQTQLKNTKYDRTKKAFVTSEGKTVAEVKSAIAAKSNELDAIKAPSATAETAATTTPVATAAAKGTRVSAGQVAKLRKTRNNLDKQIDKLTKKLAENDLVKAPNWKGRDNYVQKLAKARADFLTADQAYETARVNVGPHPAIVAVKKGLKKTNDYVKPGKRVLTDAVNAVDQSGNTADARTKNDGIVTVPQGPAAQPPAPAPQTAPAPQAVPQAAPALPAPAAAPATAPPGAKAPAAPTIGFLQKTMMIGAMILPRRRLRRLSR